MTTGTSRLHFNSLLLRALRRHARSEGGAALVETAVTMLTLLILIMGVIQACLAVYNYHYLGNAAHEAARYAIVRGSSWGTSCDGSGAAGSGYSSSQCTASPQDIASYVQSRNFPGVNIQASQVCVEYYSSVPASPTTACPGNTGPNAPGDIVQVTINYPYSFSLPGLNAYTYNLSSTSQMVIAQ